MLNWKILVLLFAVVKSSIASFFVETFQSRLLPLTRLDALGVKIRIVGKPTKTSDQKWLEDAADVYDKRIRPNGVEIETIWHKQDVDLVKGVNTDQSKGHAIIYLDPLLGKQCTSEKFSDMLYDTWFLEGGSRVCFVIGGAEGLPPSLKEEASTAIRGAKSPLRYTLSLSDMTFTHQFARTLLMEQIYRASEIRKGTGKLERLPFSSIFYS